MFECLDFLRLTTDVPISLFELVKDGREESFNWSFLDEVATSKLDSDL